MKWKLNYSLNCLKLKILNRLGLLSNKISIGRSMQYGKLRWIPVIDGTGFGEACGSQTEDWVFSVIQKINAIRPIDTFLDIGVNTGQTLLKIKAINPEAHYYGFEPNPNCIYYVEYLVRLNNFNNTHLICTALGDKHEFLKLNFEGIQDSRATLLSSDNLLNKLPFSALVSVSPLDSIDLNISDEAFLLMKIDVEGYELEVLTGSEKFIQLHTPALLFEVLPHENDSALKTRQHLLYEFLNKIKYKIFSIQQDGRLHKVSSEFGNDRDYSMTDYVAVDKDFVLS